MATKPKPACETVLKWLQDNLGRDRIAPLTGTDTRALKAAVMIVDLYSYNPDSHLTDAFRDVVLCMQQSTQELAYHSIAHVLDWNDRARLWQKASLPPIQNPRVCFWEPSGRNRLGQSAI